MSTLALKPIQFLTAEDVQSTGLVEGAGDFVAKLQSAVQYGQSEASIWQYISTHVLEQEHPAKLHKLLYQSAFLDWDVARLGPPPVWIPTLQGAAETNLGKFLERHGERLLGGSYEDPIASYPALHELSVAHPEVYWPLVLRELNVSFHTAPERILDRPSPSAAAAPFPPSSATWGAEGGARVGPGGRWLPGARLNAAEVCLQPSADGKRSNSRAALVWRNEGEDGDRCRLQRMTFKELRLQASQVARSLEAAGFREGDRIAIDMPMHAPAVVIYLGIVLAGCAVVSIADSFVASEIATRVAISEAKGIFTQDVIHRGVKLLPLYSRVVEANAPRAIVLSAVGSSPRVTLREGDLAWDDFLSLGGGGGGGGASDGGGREYEARWQAVDAPCNILFSSGTTGTPKAIPWSHATPLKAAADAWAHHDVRAGDVVAWPTNLGWMMGPWLIYAALINGAAVALFNGSPLGRSFGQFVQDARVTMLGVVPSMVKAWATSGCMAGLAWSRLRCFSSTGEASSPDDYLWLMSRGGYRCPILEYCGGTEIGGGFLTGSFLQPQALSAFSTPALGCGLVILDQDGRPTVRHHLARCRSPIPSAPSLPKRKLTHEKGEVCTGECALQPFMLGSSSKLLNADHHKVYFKGMPTYKGQVLRRHGDELERTAGGFYRAHGRVDDTMNLGGIKVSSVEIERVCNQSHEAILETAAIGVAPPGGGPELLLVAAVLKAGRQMSESELLKIFLSAVQSKLNPLFKVSRAAQVPTLPRTASNKVMRRVLRDQFSTLGKQAAAAGGRAPPRAKL